MVERQEFTRPPVIEDRIHGIVEITSPLVLELIDSKPLQRLKGIAQFGVPDEFNHLENYYRYEHCVGVMILLRKLGASEEEQIAGLCHDVSHTAFSHIIDWVVGDEKKENLQDERHKDFICNSEIAGILERHGLDPLKISHYEHFGLLEREIPNLCADRVDYALREFSPEVVKQCLGALTTHGDKIVFEGEESAALFARHFLQKQMDHWAGFESTSRFRLFADALKLALAQGTINFEDFWQDDAYVVCKLKSSTDLEIQNILTALRSKSLETLPRSDEVVSKKFRYVDPEFLHDGKLIRLSTVDKEFEQELQAACQKNSQGTAIPLI